MKGGACFKQLKDYELLKEDSAVRSYVVSWAGVWTLGIVGYFRSEHPEYESGWVPYQNGVKLAALIKCNTGGKSVVQPLVRFVSVC